MPFWRVDRNHSDVVRYRCSGASAFGASCTSLRFAAKEIADARRALSHGRTHQLRAFWWASGRPTGVITAKPKVGWFGSPIGGRGRRQSGSRNDASGCVVRPSSAATRYASVRPRLRAMPLLYPLPNVVVAAHEPTA